MKASVWLFGVKESSLRVPALAGAGLYFAAVYRLCTRALQTTGGALLAAAFVTLNPFILDLMVAARGYGLALGFGCGLDLVAWVHGRGNRVCEPR